MAAGITVHEARKAYVQLKGENIHIRVIDAYSVQPVDAATLIAAGKATNGVIITVEDHYAVGGLGDAVSEAVASAGWRSTASPCARFRAAASPTSCSIATAFPPGTSSTPSRSPA